MSDKFTTVLSKDARASLILSLTEMWEEVEFMLSSKETQELRVHFEACEWREFEDYLCVILTGLEPCDDAVVIAQLIAKASVLRASKVNKR